MRLMRFTFLFLLLISPKCFAQQQYTEAACLLLQQQADRFAGQPNGSTYLDTRRQLNNHCQNTIPTPERELNLTNAPAKTNSVTPTKAAPSSAVTAPVKVPKPVAQAANNPSPPKPADVIQALFAPVIAVFGGLLVFIVLFGGGIAVLGIAIGGLFGNKAKFLGAIAERSLHKLSLKQLPISYQHYRNLILQTALGDLTEVDHLKKTACIQMFGCLSRAG